MIVMTQCATFVIWRAFGALLLCHSGSWVQVGAAADPVCHIYTHATIVIQCATFVNWWALSALLICHSGSFTPSWCHGRSCVAHLKTQYVPVHDVSRIYTHDFDLVSHTCELAGSRCPTDVPFQAGALADPVSHVCDPACHICELAGSWCPTIPDPQVGRWWIL